MRCDALTLSFMCQRCAHIERGVRADGLRYVASQMDNGNYDDADERCALFHLSLPAVIRSRAPVQASIDGHVNGRRLRVRRDAEERARAEALLVHKCPTCGRKFTTVAGLRTHQRSHKVVTA